MTVDICMSLKDVIEWEGKLSSIKQYDVSSNVPKRFASSYHWAIESTCEFRRREIFPPWILLKIRNCVTWILCCGFTVNFMCIYWSHEICSISASEWAYCAFEKTHSHYTLSGRIFMIKIVTCPLLGNLKQNYNWKNYLSSSLGSFRVCSHTLRFLLWMCNLHCWRSAWGLVSPCRQWS